MPRSCSSVLINMCSRSLLRQHPYAQSIIMANALCRKGSSPPRVPRVSPSSNTAIRRSTNITTPAYAAKAHASLFPTFFSTVHPPLTFAARQEPITNLLAGTFRVAVPAKTTLGPIPRSCVASSRMISSFRLSSQ